LVCIALGALWVRSFAVTDYIFWVNDENRWGGAQITMSRGTILLSPGQRWTARNDAEMETWLEHKFTPGLSLLTHRPPIDVQKLGHVAAPAWWQRIGIGPLPVSSVGGSAEAGFLVPLWLGCLAFGLLPAIRAGALIRARLRSQRNLCPTCGYDLRATPDGCPECGYVPAKVPSQA
jgi:hypothetical protein